MKSDENKNNEINFRACRNAGIVLLLPFLNNLFENLNLVENGKFLNENNSKIAVQILVYLSTASQTTSEEDCLLPKLLCGIENNNLINFELPLNNEQIQECETLLQSVIEYWSVLKNTSIEGFRKSFLQRDGRIKSNEIIYLEVENSGIDIFLNNLPWSFSNYKLPWMTKLIKTEWQ